MMPLVTADNLTRQTEDERLREGLKEMFVKTHQALNLSPAMSFVKFIEYEDNLVDAFIGGLRNNGYDIVALDNQKAADESS